jgi:hypothetical protein
MGLDPLLAHSAAQLGDLPLQSPLRASPQERRRKGNRTASIHFRY